MHTLRQPGRPVDMAAFGRRLHLRHPQGLKGHPRGNPLPARDWPSDTTLASHTWEPSSNPRTAACANSEMNWIEPRGPMSPTHLQSLATAFVPRFCHCWCQVRYHGTVAPHRLHPRAEKMQASLVRCLGGILRVPSSDGTWLHTQVPMKKGASAAGTPCSILSRPSRPPPPAQRLCATTHRTTQTSQQPARDFKAPLTTTQVGTLAGPAHDRR